MNSLPPVTTMGVLIASLGVAVLFALLIVAGLYTRKWVVSGAEWLLSGREISYWVNVGGIYGAAFAGTSVAVHSAHSIVFGFWPSVWFTIAISVAFIVYGACVAGFAQRVGSITLPEWIETRCDGRTRVVMSVSQILAMLGIIATNMSAVGFLIMGYTGLPYMYTVIISIAITLFFVYLGGLWAVSITDVLQVILGLLCVYTLLLVLRYVFGDLDWLWEKMATPDWRLSWPGRMHVWSLKHPSYLTWLVLMVIGVAGNSYYWLRTVSCRGEKTARASYITVGITYTVAVGIPMTIISLYALAKLGPEFFPAKADPASAWALMARFLPDGAAALIFVSALAASVSTGATAILGAASTASRDVYQRVFNPAASSRQLLIASRILTVVFSLAVLALCFYPGGPVFLFAFGFAFMVPPGILLFIAMVWRRLTPTAGFVAMLVGMASIIAWQLTPSLMVYGHQVWIGLVLTPATAVVLSLVTKGKYYSEPSWTLKPSSSTGPDSKASMQLTEQDLALLAAVRTRWETMAELIDFFKSDAKVISELIEPLDKHRYLHREGFRGSKFYTFALTEKGESVLSPLSAEERKLARLGLTPEDLTVLQGAAQNPGLVNERLAEILRMDPEDLNPVIGHLCRLGHLSHAGIWRRRISVNRESLELVATYKQMSTA